MTCSSSRAYYLKSTLISHFAVSCLKVFKISNISSMNTFVIICLTHLLGYASMYFCYQQIDHHCSTHQPTTHCYDGTQDSSCIILLLYVYQNIKGNILFWYRSWKSSFRHQLGDQSTCVFTLTNNTMHYTNTNVTWTITVGLLIWHQHKYSLSFICPHTNALGLRVTTPQYCLIYSLKRWLGQINMIKCVCQKFILQGICSVVHSPLTICV